MRGERRLSPERARVLSRNSQNEDGLAAVLGHEVAHQVARHAGERMSSQKINLALSFLASFLGVDPNLTAPAVGLLLTLPNSRAAETEADHVGNSY
jgi:Zn-dependent protease with chaperone function